MPQEGVGASHKLMCRTRAFLERLESGWFAARTDMPEEIISAMTAVHKLVNCLEPPPPASLEWPLQATADNVVGSSRGGEGDAPEEDTCMTENEVIGKLESIDDSDNEALLEIARSLKRARRM